MNSDNSSISFEDIIIPIAVVVIAFEIGFILGRRYENFLYRLILRARLLSKEFMEKEKDSESTSSSTK